jgi:hypothetical protein
MIRIDANTVELTPGEQVALDYFERLLDEGYGIHEAVAVIRQAITDLRGQGIAEHIVLSEEFYAYLSA